jgi:hypothetical protein
VNYLAYGWQVHSAEPLPAVPEIPGGTGPADVRFERAPSALDPSRLDWFLSWPLPSGDPWLSVARAEAGFVLRFHGHLDFEVDRHGRRITCAARCGVAPETVGHLLIDHVLPRVLNLRGREALHASAVLTPDGAVAFTGPSGSGKSTVAAELVRAGCAVLADDCLVIEEHDGRFRAVPAYPGLRLWNDAIERLFPGTGRHPVVADYSDKRRVSLDGTVALDRRSYPLRRVHVLGEPSGRDAETAPARRDLGLRDALAELIRRAFRFDVGDRTMLERQLHFFARLAAAVPVSRLEMPHGLHRLADLELLALEHADRSPSGAGAVPASTVSA